MLTITTKNFENDVLHADKPVLVDFWAQWCPYCRRIAPAFDKVGEQYADTLIAGKINYDEEPQLIQRFGIDTIPTLLLFKNGEVIGSVAGNPNAIGYASLSAVDESVVAVKVNGVTPSEATVKDGTYEIQRPFVMVTKEGTELSAAAQTFLDWAMSADAADEIEAAGCVSPNA